MEPQETKRDMILDAALTLFADKGYDATSIDEIGDAVGVKGPALYHYFKGKEALLDGIVEKMEEYYEMQFGTAKNIDHYPEDLNELAAMSMKRLQFTIHDPKIKKVRKLMAKEQFRNDRIKTLTTMHQFTDIIEMNATFFERLIRDGKVKDYDPKLISFEFTTPISMLIQLIDREPDKEEEVMKKIKEHMDHFIIVYGI